MLVALGPISSGFELKSPLASILGRHLGAGGAGGGGLACQTAVDPAAVLVYHPSCRPCESQSSCLQLAFHGR